MNDQTTTNETEGMGAASVFSAELERIDVTGLKHDPALSDEDVAAIFAAGDRGDEAEMRRIVESRGLTWFGGKVEPASEETSHLQPPDE